MSLSTPDEPHRSRSKSPGPRDRQQDRSPARARSPHPEGDDSRYHHYQYAELKVDYASPPQVDEPLLDMPAPLPSYQYTAHPQFDLRNQPGYGQPSQYAHDEVKANYADLHRYAHYDPQPSSQHSQASAPPLPQGYGEFAMGSEYVRGPPKEHPHYAAPAPYQYAHEGDQGAAAGRPPPPPSSMADSTQPRSFSIPGGYPPPSMGLHDGRARSSPYAATPAYVYAHPAQLPQPTTVKSPTSGRSSVGHGQQPPPPTPPHPQAHRMSGPDYAKPQTYQYVQPDERINYKYKSGAETAAEPPSPPPSHPHAHHVGGPDYAKPQTYQYAQPDERITYSYKSSAKTAAEEAKARPEKSGTNKEHKGKEPANVIEIQPGGGALHAPPSPGLGSRMRRLSVSGQELGSVPIMSGAHGGGGGVGPVPPGSPLLEAYHGTYQSISPMPSPMMPPSYMRHHDDDPDGLSPLLDEGTSDESTMEEVEKTHFMEMDSKMSNHGQEKGKEKNKKKQGQLHIDTERYGGGGREWNEREQERPKEKEKKKRVKFYDAEKDARELAEVLRHRTVDPEPLIKILPRLTHEQMMQLRTEYKKHARVQGKGINVAKHIKMKIGSGGFGKACYATALGRWEGEAYWANFWYQSNSSRRELLIESLMGRTNAEMAEIKAAFSDKRYNDSLERCMKAELKADKFRYAILLALDERRQEESIYVYADAVRDDVRSLHHALISPDGGETTMIRIVVTRSDTQMQEVLKQYERTYRKNFAKEMLRKSNNLVVSHRSSSVSLFFFLHFPPFFFGGGETSLTF